MKFLTIGNVPRRIIKTKCSKHAIVIYITECCFHQMNRVTAEEGC